MSWYQATWDCDTQFLLWGNMVLACASCQGLWHSPVSPVRDCSTLLFLRSGTVALTCPPCQGLWHSPVPPVRDCGTHLSLLSGTVTSPVPPVGDCGTHLSLLSGTVTLNCASCQGLWHSAAPPVKDCDTQLCLLSGTVALTCPSCQLLWHSSVPPVGDCGTHLCLLSGDPLLLLRLWGGQFLSHLFPWSRDLSRDLPSRRSLVLSRDRSRSSDRLLRECNPRLLWSRDLRKESPEVSHISIIPTVCICQSFTWPGWYSDHISISKEYQF